LEPNVKQFIWGLLLCLGLLVPTLACVHLYGLGQKYIDLSLIGSLIFVIMSFLLFFFLKLSLQSSNKQLFLSVTLANMLAKMVLSIVFLLIYRKLNTPPDNKFIFPFLIVYIYFTIFETWFMVKLAYQKP
jgi:hypothetical protein